MSCPPNLRGCRLDCGHRRIVCDDRDERERQELAAEAAWRTRDGDPDAPALVTFRGWLVARAGRRVAG